MFSGGTGSGLGTLIMEHCREHYPDKVMLAFAVVPSMCTGESRFQPYNAVLAFHQLIENCDGGEFIADTHHKYSPALFLSCAAGQHSIVRHLLSDSQDQNTEESIWLSASQQNDHQRNVRHNLQLPLPWPTQQ